MRAHNREAMAHYFGLRGEEWRRDVATVNKENLRLEMSIPWKDIVLVIYFKWYWLCKKCHQNF